MNRRKKGSFKKLLVDNQSISIISYSSNKNLLLFDNSYSSNKNLLLFENSYSSNKPWFIDLIINRGIDDNRLKGGFR